MTRHPAAAPHSPGDRTRSRSRSTPGTAGHFTRARPRRHHLHHHCI